MTGDLIQIPFAGGPDEQTDPRHLPPGSVISALNQVYDTDGSYQVRFGYTQLSGGSIAAVKRLAVFANELCAIDGSTLWTWSTQGAAWVSKDRVPPVGVTRKPMMSSAVVAYDSQSVVVASGYRVVAWIDLDNMPHAAVFDATTDALVQAPVTLVTTGSVSSVTNISLGVIGTTAVLIVSCADGVHSVLQGWTLALASLGTWSAATQLGNSGSYPLANFSGAYACAWLSSTVVIGYEAVVSGTAKLILRSFNSSLSLQAETATTFISNASVPSTLIMQSFGALGVSGERIWIAVWAIAGSNSTQGIYVGSFDPSLLTMGAGSFEYTTGVGVLEKIQTLGIARLSSTKCCVVFNWMKTASNTAMGWFNVDTSGTLSMAAAAYNCAAQSQPVTITSLGTTYVLAKTTAQYNDTSDSLSQFTYALLDLRTDLTSGSRTAQVLKVLAPFTAGTIYNTGASQTNVSALVANGSTVYEAALLVGRGQQRYGMDKVRIDLTSTHRWRPAYLGREGYLGSDRYDGERVVESGFLHAPHVKSASGTGSGSMSGTWQYLATFTYVDDQGNAEESAPGPTALTVTVTSKASINVVVACTWLTNKQRIADYTTKVVLVNLYRTQDTSSGDSNWYLVSSNNINSLAAETITINDSLGDGNLTDGTHRLLYTLTGELPHWSPESFTDVVAHKNRIWGIGADQRTIWYSQQYSDGSIPTFAQLQTLTVDDTDEPLLALASLYDKLLVFTARRIYVVFGDGPSPAGTANDLSEPQRIPSPAGCIDARSIVATPHGVMFQGAQGLFLIDNGLSVTFIGARVAVTTATYPICTSAVFCQSTNTVRFTFTTAETVPASAGDTGVIVLYDTRRDRWAVHAVTKGGAQTSATLAPMQSAAYHPTMGYVAAHNDTAAACLIYRENVATDATPWLDFGTYFVPLQVTTAWIKAGDLEGWQSVRRIRVLANYYDAHGLQVNPYRDYQTVGETHSFFDSTIAGIVNGSWEQVKVTPSWRGCEALQLYIATTTPSIVGSGRGAGLTGLALEVIRKKGGYRRFASAARS